MARSGRAGWMAVCAARSIALLAAPILSPIQGLSQSPPAPRPKSPPASPGKPAATPDPAFEAAKAAFEALPEAERKGLQDALVWTGDFNGVVTGTFGKRTHDALVTYQKRAGGAGTASLDPAGRGALLKAGAAARSTVGFAVKSDPASGTVLGLPERLLPKRAAIPGGTRWQSADGRITVEAKSFPPGETSLEAVFARITAPSPERRVTYKLQRPDFLVVTAETATGKSYIRYAAGETGVRGLTLGYDKALAETFDRLVIAIANSFVPFPDAAPAAPSSPIARAGPTPPPLADRPAAPHATGLLVGPGRVLTSAAALDGCTSPRINGQAARIMVRDTDLILLDGAGLASSGVFPPLRAEAAVPAEAVLVLSAEAGGAVTAAPGALGQDGRITAPLQPGAGGAPIVDPAGALAGLVSAYPAAPRRVAGVVPPARYGSVASARIGQFLTAAGVPVPAAGASTVRLAGAIVGIACQP